MTLPSTERSAVNPAAALTVSASCRMKAFPDPDPTLDTSLSMILNPVHGCLPVNMVVLALILYVLDSFPYTLT